MAQDLLIIAVGDDRREIAVRHLMGRTPTIMWLSGFRSVMDGEKASTLATRAHERGQAMLRFDYSGMGHSGGDFLDGTISRWLEEAECVAAQTDGPLLIVGSSMGGLIATELAKKLHDNGRTLCGLVLIAPAVGMTVRMREEAKNQPYADQLAEKGYFERPSRYDDGPYPITAKLIEDGNHFISSDEFPDFGCPIHILHGALDEDVPLTVSEALLPRLARNQVSMTIVPDGDHRLSREQDKALLQKLVKRYSAI